MQYLFREPTHRPIAIVRIVLGLLLLGDALRTPQRPMAGQILTVLLSVSLLVSGSAELLPRPWRYVAGVLRTLSLIGWGSCLLALLVFLVRVR